MDCTAQTIELQKNYKLLIIFNILIEIGAFAIINDKSTQNNSKQINE